MNKIRFPISIKFNYGLMTLLLSLLFVNCKSAEISYLGYFHKTIKKAPDSSEGSDETLNETQIKISGFIMDSLQQPITKASIDVKKQGQIIPYAASDENGYYLINTTLFPSNVSSSIRQTIAWNDSIGSKTNDPNTYMMSVSANGFQTKEMLFELNNNEAALNFTLEKLSTISGFVMKSHASPVNDALLLLEKQGEIISSEQTASDGRFVFSELEEGTYHLTVSHSKYAFFEKFIHVKRATDYKDIKIVAANGIISGSITAKNPKHELGESIVTLQRTGFENYSSGQPVQIIDTIQSDENYQFEGLVTGSYRLTVEAEGYGSVSANIELQEQQPQYEQNFELSKEGTVSGKLINYSEGEEIDIFLISDTHVSIKNTFEIKNDGEYKLRGIASGFYAIIVKWKGTLFMKNSIQVSSGENTGTIDFVLKEEKGSISGTIISEIDQTPIANALVTASSENSANYATSDKNGQYKIIGLKPGIYGILVSKIKCAIGKRDNLILDDENLNHINLKLNCDETN